MTAVMITDGNNFHPADYHAEITAEKIVVVGENTPANVTSAARTFRKKVEAILTRHHTAVEVAEQAALSAQGTARYGADLQECALATTDASVIADIVAAARGTVLETHFAQPAVQE